MTTINDIFYVWPKYREGELMVDVSFQEGVPPFEVYRYTRGEIQASRPAVLEVVDEGTLTDKIHTGSPQLLVLRQRFFDLLEQQGLSGWSSYPVVVDTLPGGVGESYAGLIVTGRVKHTDFNLCQRETRLSMYGQPEEVRIGPHFDLSTWDGSDIFIADPMYICVTRRFKEVVEEHFDIFDFVNVTTFTKTVL